MIGRIAAGVAVVLLLLVVVVVVVGLWGSSGTLVDFVEGQRDPGPSLERRDVSQAGGDEAPYAVEVAVDLETAVGELPPEYLSFAIDTSQVVGGKWWDPEAAGSEVGSGTVHAPEFDFERPALDKLTAALAPAYLRIGGSEADKTYYDMSGDGTVPEGYESVMTREQWDAINDYARRNGLELIFTLNAGPGARDSEGRWNPENAEALMAYTAEQGYQVKGWELGNELNIFWFVHGLGEQVDAEQYAADLEAARALAAKYTPEATFSGQGSAFWPLFGEPLSLFYGFMADYAEQSGGETDTVSWHYYPQQSRRGPIASRRAYPGRLLDPENLDEAAHWAERVRELRDEHAPGKPIWLGETGNAQFGGEPGLSDVYLGGLWWLDQLGLLARHDHDVVVRQTLSGMDYGMIEDETLTPRPDYWNSLLWKRLMGSTVYGTEAQGEQAEKVRVYAQATPGEEGGVTLLVLNLDHERDAAVSFPQFEGLAYEEYEVTSPDIFGGTVLLNGEELALAEDLSLPEIAGRRHEGGEVPEVTVNPLSYSFVVFSRAKVE